MLSWYAHWWDEFIFAVLKCRNRTYCRHSLSVFVNNNHCETFFWAFFLAKVLIKFPLTTSTNNKCSGRRNTPGTKRLHNKVSRLESRRWNCVDQLNALNWISWQSRCLNFWDCRIVDTGEQREDFRLTCVDVGRAMFITYKLMNLMFQIGCRGGITFWSP